MWLYQLYERKSIEYQNPWGCFKLLENMLSPNPPRDDKPLEPSLADEESGVENKPALNIAGLERDGVLLSVEWGFIILFV